MPDSLAEKMEPLPGYRLIEPLGSGGFGEVWKSTAPGGLLKAIKFVHGVLNVQGGGAARELKSLQRIKDLQHPFLLSLERIDIVEDQLVIVMELADCSLADRLAECRSQGLPGIPRKELLRYLAEAAEALDLLNQQYQIQHMDIKPQNLFLIREHIKVADFGLAQDLEGTHATLSGGITPTYAAPETFGNVVSPQCDQYSLAIVYQELLTGRRPFNGRNARQLMAQHLSMPPDLSALPAPDRAIVRRALAKQPTRRFASCVEFIRALPRQAELPSANVSIATTAAARNDHDLSSAGATAPRVRSDQDISLEDSELVCPRCNFPAPPDQEFHYCKVCGFEPEPDAAESPPPRSALFSLPWYGTLILGATVIVAAAMVGNEVFPIESETRAIWGLSQCGTGVLLVFIAQLWAVVLLATEEHGIGLREAVLPTARLWWRVVRHLPVTRWAVYFLVWGVLLTGSGLYFGDATYWSRLPTTPKARPAG